MPEKFKNKVEMSLAVGFYDSGIKHADNGNYIQSIADFTKVIQLNPIVPEAYYNRAIAYDKIGDYQNAVSDFGQVIKIDPENAKAFFNRGLVNQKQRKWTEAIADFTYAINIKPHLDIYFKRGVTYALKGDFLLAIEDFTEVIKECPQDTRAYANRGSVYSEHGDYTQAMSDFNKALELDPNSSMVYYSRGILHFYLRENQKAWEDIHEAKRRGLNIGPGFIQMLTKASGSYYLDNPYNVPTHNQWDKSSCTSHALAFGLELILSERFKERVLIDADDLWEKQLRHGTAIEEDGDTVDGVINIACQYGLKYKTQSGKEGVFRPNLEDFRKIR